MKKVQYSIVIEFRYGMEEDGPFYELSDRFNERLKKADAPGAFDGHELAIDNFDARYFFYSYTPAETLDYIDDLLKEYGFLSGGRIYIRNNSNNYTTSEVEMIGPDGKRTPLSKFDAEQLSIIPEWGTRRGNYTDSSPGDEWKDKLKNERAEKLYNKWKEIDYLINAIWDKWDLSAIETESAETGDDENAIEDEYDLTLPGELIEWHREEMQKNSLLIPAKISGAEAADLYILRMENAAIIRKAAFDIYLDCAMLEENVAEEQDIELLRTEINQFRLFFIEWINGFEKDGYEDEWGVFV